MACTVHTWHERPGAPLIARRDSEDDVDRRRTVAQIRHPRAEASQTKLVRCNASEAVLLLQVNATPHGDAVAERSKAESGGTKSTNNNNPVPGCLTIDKCTAQATHDVYYMYSTARFTLSKSESVL